MPFSVSFGDVIVSIQLMKKIIAGLQTVNGAASQYQELDRELFAFQRALHQIEHLQLSDEHKPALDALKCVALVSQHALKGILAKLEKYDKSLGIGKSVSGVKTLKRKIEFSMGMEDEVCKLRDIISAHRGELNLCLNTMSFSRTSAIEKELKEQGKTLKLLALAISPRTLEFQVDGAIDWTKNMSSLSLGGGETLVDPHSSQSSPYFCSALVEEPVRTESTKGRAFSIHSDDSSPQPSDCEDGNLPSQTTYYPFRKKMPMRKRFSPLSQGTVAAELFFGSQSTIVVDGGENGGDAIMDCNGKTMGLGITKRRKGNDIEMKGNNALYEMKGNENEAINEIKGDDITT